MNVSSRIDAPLESPTRILGGVSVRRQRGIGKRGNKLGVMPGLDPGIHGEVQQVKHYGLYC